MMKPQEKGKNVIKTLEEFLESSKEKHEPTATPTLLFEPYEALNIDKLFRDVNCIKTNANKSLTKDGDWKYNGFNTYDITYVLTEDNKLLVVKQVGSLQDSLLPEFITFRLYPNAGDFIFSLKPGHDDHGYISIKDKTGRIMNCYHFERPDSDMSIYDGFQLKNVLENVDLKQLIEEYKEKVNSRTFGSK